MSKIIKSKQFKIYLSFFICFWGFIIPKTYDMYKYGYVALGGWDSVTQMYPVMLYVSRMIRGFFEAFLSGNTYVIPMFEINLGMGDDLITALNWHGFGDPFYLLTALVSENNLPFFYTFLFYLRVFLGGIAFILFVQEHDRTKSIWAYTIGGMVYVFTGFTLQSNYHIIFVHAMMYIPMMLLGAERTLNGKKKGVLTLSTFLFALSGFFFLYIGSIALGVYVCYRLLSIRRRWRDSLKNILEMIAEYLVGIALAAFIFLPAVLGFLSSSRAHVQTEFNMIFSWTEIKQFLFNTFFPQNNDQVFSVAVIGIITILLYLGAKGKIKEKINIIFLFLIAIMPPVSCLMSGFGEIYDRWELVLTIYAAFLVVELWDTIEETNLVQKIVLIGLFCFMGIIGKKKDWWDKEQFWIVMISYGIILLFMLVVLPLCNRINKRFIGSFLFFVIMIIMIDKSWQCNARDREISAVQERNVVSELVEDSSVYRISNERTFTEPRNGQNIALMQKYNGLSEYFSIENTSFTNALLEWDVNPDSSSNHMNVGLDQRTVLETLSSVKYMIKRAESDVLVPYGYEWIKNTEDGEWSLYENTNSLPLVYSYDYVWKKGCYEGKNGFYKQQMILNAAGIENYDGNVDTIEIADSRLRQLDYTIVNVEKGKINGNQLDLEAGAEITLEVCLGTKGENYISFDDVDLQGSFSVSVPKEKRLKEVRVTPDFRNGNMGVNLGSASNDKKQKVIISFLGEEHFKVEHLSIYNYDFEDFGKCIDRLRKVDSSNIIVNTNHIQYTIDVDTPQINCIAVPYSKGWSAKIDGKETKIYKVNDMFMGIEIPKGNHLVEMTYVTYGMKTGLTISVCAIGLIVILFIVENVKKKSEKYNGKDI